MLRSPSSRAPVRQDPCTADSAPTATIQFGKTPAQQTPLLRQQSSSARPLHSRLRSYGNNPVRQDPCTADSAPTATNPVRQDPCTADTASRCLSRFRCRSPLSLPHVPYWPCRANTFPFDFGSVPLRLDPRTADSAPTATNPVRQHPCTADSA